MEFWNSEHGIVHDFTLKLKKNPKRLEKEGFRVKRTSPSMTIKGFSKPMLNGDIIAVRKDVNRKGRE